ncbi:hypothetical protein V5P93_004455 [Actinokineospora auranticolor]|uniref:Uncharacterized protein n=1 Tax=Actinokineospora auranticolor TaxID=155976 RepID=A0A2S6GT53_9PSEU|nr:hypothetical protein [Actinokineospora auranticolor]PPK68438.1 hypothetical protein CLV40_105161 [Actinokineospora auranticolor]
MGAHAERVTVLDGGKVVAIGPPAEVRTATLSSEVYRTSPEHLPGRSELSTDLIIFAAGCR